MTVERSAVLIFRHPTGSLYNTYGYCMRRQDFGNVSVMGFVRALNAWAGTKCVPAHGNWFWLLYGTDGETNTARFMNTSKAGFVVIIRWSVDVWIVNIIVMFCVSVRNEAIILEIGD